MKSYRIHTYGCQMNAHESERLRHMLCAGGLWEAQNPETADILIFQTCSIRDTAARKILTHINQAKRLRQKTASKQKICVIGCLSAHKKIDGVDISLGTNQLEQLVEMLCGSKPDVRFGAGNSVIIAHGCENFCSYCIVPHVRGKEFSRPADEIEHEFQEILKTNNKEVIYLLGQNVNSYRCPKTDIDFVGLLDRLCAINGDFVLNFMSSHPKDFSDSLIDCIARNPKIERNIHLPMQSGCNKILKAMNRKYTIQQYSEIIRKLRSKVAGVRITTDIICGFPGESEADFAETVRAVKDLKFNAAFIFAYSAREGTAAAIMDGQIDTKEKLRRTTNLINIQREISAAL